MGVTVQPLQMARQSCPTIKPERKRDTPFLRGIGRENVRRGPFVTRSFDLADRSVVLVAFSWVCSTINHFGVCPDGRASKNTTARDNGHANACGTAKQRLIGDRITAGRKGPTDRHDGA